MHQPSCAAGSFLIAALFTGVAMTMGGCEQSPFEGEHSNAPAEESASVQVADTSAPSQAAAQADAGATAIPTVRLAPAFPKLTFQRPVFFTHAGDGSNRVFVVEQLGRIMAFENRSDVDQAQPFLDIRDRVRMRHNEEGLLSLVFHPKFAENGQFFVYYSVSDPKRNRIARFNVMKDDPTRGDPASELVILDVEQRYGNHNGSTLLFGPDGMLYASFGDGGWADDPDFNGQNLGTLLASIIRINVDQPDGERPYSIPKDNPFVDRPNARPEIWAYGLRNVWRMSFDSKTGELWAGDVGQNRWEEIDLIVKGGNYGWNRREGAHDFAAGVQKYGSEAPADAPIDPVVEYGRREGISVTGGYVYRGSKQPKLQGVYMYADYGSRTIWGLRHAGGKMVAQQRMAGGTDSSFITSFGEDAEGEVYVCAFDRPDHGRPGRVMRIVAE